MSAKENEAPRDKKAQEGTPSADDLKSLNADDLDARELDDKLLEDTAGGAPCWGFDCGTFTCGTHSETLE